MLCPHDVTISTWYIVPQDIMYLWRNCCRMAHLMSNSRELSEIWLQRLCTRIALQYIQRVLARISVILCAGHCSVRRVFVTSITCVILFAWRGVLSFANIISRLKRIWGKRSHLDVTSRSCFLVCLHLILFVYMEELVRVLLCSFLPY